jgi:hypothetical protein
MNARKAKKIRRKVYGKGHHPGPVTYRKVNINTQTIVADDYRKIYQDMKMVNK